MLIPSEFNKCPRARRLFFLLSKQHQVDYIARPSIGDEKNTHRRGYLHKNVQSQFTRWLIKALLRFNLTSIAVKRYAASYEYGQIKDGEYDYIFVYHLYLLPLLTGFTKTKIIFDARECYPVQRAHDPSWRLSYGKMAMHICETYMPQCDLVTTVSPSMVEYYAALISVKCHLFPSYPREELRLTSTHSKSTGEPIRLVHHGIADSKRGLERMIELMDRLKGKFTLDLMLVSQPGNQYFIHLKKMAEERDNVSIVDPVAPDEVIRFTSGYDMGIFLPLDNGSQNKYCLPNKYFEFVYAGLPVITSAADDMKTLTEQNEIGIAFLNESLDEIALCLRKLTIADIQQYRHNIQSNTKDWTLQANVKRVFPELLMPKV